MKDPSGSSVHYNVATNLSLLTYKVIMQLAVLFFYVRSSPKFMVLNAEPKFGGTINSVSGHICLVVQLENSYAERKYSV